MFISYSTFLIIILPCTTHNISSYCLSPCLGLAWVVVKLAFAWLVVLVIVFLVVLVVLVVVFLVVLPLLVVVLLVVLPLLVVLVRLAVIVRVMVVGAIVVLGILVVYIIYVSVVVPTDGVVEVVSLLEALPLSGVEHAFELLVAIVPSVSVDVTIAAYAVEIVEIDVQEAVALSTVQSQLHNHLVGDEAGSSLNICESLCIG